MLFNNIVGCTIKSGTCTIKFAPSSNSNVVYQATVYTCRKSIGLEIQGRGFNFQLEALELHFSQLVPVGS